jgi:hypothetical membrane protein
LNNFFPATRRNWNPASLNNQIQAKLISIRFAVYHIALIAGILSPVVIVIADLIGVMTGKTYNPITQSISDLGLGNAGWMQTAAFIIFGITAISLASEMYNELHREHEVRLGFILMTAIGAGFILLGLFPTDPLGTYHSLHGFIHHYSAWVEGALSPAVCFFFADVFRTKTEWRILVRYSLIAGVMGCILVLVWAIFEKNWFGFSERLIILNGLIWFEVIAIHLRQIIEPPKKISRHI